MGVLVVIILSKRLESYQANLNSPHLLMNLKVIIGKSNNIDVYISILILLIMLNISTSVNFSFRWPKTGLKLLDFGKRIQ